MPASKLARVGTRQQLVRNTLATPQQISRVVATQAAAISNLETQQVTRSVVVVSLGVGANTVNTNLGRKARGCTLCPTVADATFAWSFAVNGDAQATITVLNVAQPNCPLEFY